AGRDPDSIAIGLVIHTITEQNPDDVSAMARSMAAGFYEYSPALFATPGIEWNGPPVEELQTQVWPDFHHADDLVASGRLVGFLSDEAANSFSLFGSAARLPPPLP